MKYLLDTNICSYLIKGTYPRIKVNLESTPINQIYISSITEAELLHGSMKKSEATNIQKAVEELLAHLQILPWDSNAAKSYASLKIYCSANGKSLSAMDMLIAAHSRSEDCILITNDKAFYHMKDYLTLQDWTI